MTDLHRLTSSPRPAHPMRRRLPPVVTRRPFAGTPPVSQPVPRGVVTWVDRLLVLVMFGASAWIALSTLAHLARQLKGLFA